MELAAPAGASFLASNLNPCGTRSSKGVGETDRRFRTSYLHTPKDLTKEWVIRRTSLIYDRRIAKELPLPPEHKIRWSNSFEKAGLQVLCKGNKFRCRLFGCNFFLVPAGRSRYAPAGTQTLLADPISAFATVVEMLTLCSPALFRGIA